MSFFTSFVDIAFGGGLALGLVGLAVGNRLTKNKSLHIDSGHFIINHGFSNQISISSPEIKKIEYKKAEIFSQIANSPVFNKEEDFYNLTIITTENKEHKFFIAERELN